MFRTKVTLFTTPLRQKLDADLAAQIDSVMRLTDRDLLAPGAARERVKLSRAPELVRAEVEISPNVAGDKVSVRYFVPVAGDINLMKFRPDGHAPSRIRADITDDLHWARDKQPGTFESAMFAEPHPASPAGLILNKVFPGDVDAEVIKQWGRDQLDEIEAYLPSIREQLAAHDEHRQGVLLERAEARSQALANATSLKDALGGGL